MKPESKHDSGSLKGNRELEPLMIVGVGPATGTTLCRRLAGKYRLLLVARSEERLRGLEAALPDTHAFPCDVADVERWQAVLEDVRTRFGAPRRILLNTESATWGDYNELPLDRFAASFEVNAVAFLQLVQGLFPDRAAIPEDARIIISSSPAAYDPPARFLGLAPSRVAQRVMAELLHESLENSGLRFSVFSIDGAIDEPKMRAVFPDQSTAYFIQPEAIAEKIEALFEGAEFPLSSGISGPSSFGSDRRPVTARNFDG